MITRWQFYKEVSQAGSCTVQLLSAFKFNCHLMTVAPTANKPTAAGPTTVAPQITVPIIVEVTIIEPIADSAAQQVSTATTHPD